MAASKRKPNADGVGGDRVVYSEFGGTSHSDAFERPGSPELPPNQQNVRVQASRKGRKGKTVTVITGFQTSLDTLNALLKQLKTRCGAGGTVKDNEIEIQGDHCQTIVQVLVQAGYKAKVSGGKG
ncbi:MAG TPA: translation initiation factor [Chroococcidiopsis sp.]